MHVSCASMILGLALYSLAYYTNFLYLILIGRCVNGFGFTSFMYSKKYCSDPRIVGVRQRTTLASWLVIGQGIGLSLGPFAGGLFYKVGFKNAIFNGYTSPTWVMAGIWCLFWICATLWFEDPPAEQEDYPMHTISTAPSSTVPPEPENGIQVMARNNLSALHTNVSTSLNIAKSHTGGSVPDLTSLHANSTSSPPAIPTSPVHQAPLHLRLLRRLGMTSSQLGVTICMCWFAMTCFFILGAWEANLPVFGAFFPKFHWSPYAAGNFIALGGITTFPFLIANIFLARRLQDRHLLAFGTGLGTIALFIFLSLLRADKVNYASAFICWWAVALGFNLATTVTMSLLSKQLPPSWNAWSSMMIQYSNYTGRVTGAIWGGSGVTVGMPNYVGLEIAIVGIGVLLFTSLWKELKAKTG
jgi:MFS family permease